MIDNELLTTNLAKFLEKRMLPALRARSETEKDLDKALREEHTLAKAAGRTSQAFEMWRDDFLTQVGVAWALGCVFVRFAEDNGLVDAKENFPRIAGSPTGGKSSPLQQARDQYDAYLREIRNSTDRDYLLRAFEDISKLRGCRELFSKEHNPLWAHDGLLMDADAATDLLKFFQQLDDAGSALRYDFADPNLSTRFLGDLYQNLSEAARKKYALLQTPDFVEEFILDRTLEPAIKEFGLCDQKGRELSAQKEPIPSDHLLRMIDPTVGSGHFLLGGFERLFAHWQKQEPMTEPVVLAERCLNSLFGVDLNPYAANIARFRLLVAALRACGIKRLREARDWMINIAVGDSLRHGAFAGGMAGGELFESQVRSDAESEHVTGFEDLSKLRRFLMPHRYHVVVGNPPYITVKDAALSEAYRRRYGSCHRQYALTVPFFERFFDLAVVPEGAEVSTAGFVGKITGNAFMKREFGKKLIETFLPRWDLTHVIDTAGAYLPGHGTPTVILFGRHRAPVSQTIRAVLGIRGEPSTPEDPGKAFVWSAILNQISNPGSVSEFISVSDTSRESFQKHPWSIGGGGAAELKETLEEATESILNSYIDEIGRTTVVGEDDAWILDWPTIARRGATHVVPLCVGDCVRDFIAVGLPPVIYPYAGLGGSVIDGEHPDIRYWLWPYRTLFANRTVFGKTLRTMGRPWYEHLEHYRDKLRSPLSIAFAEVATHNHFILDRGGKVFKQTAPVIKLAEDANEDDHLALIGLLNSAASGFWLKQVCQNKGSTVDQQGARQRTMPFEDFYQFNGTKLQQFPVPWKAEGTNGPPRAAVMAVARDIDTLAQARAQLLPTSLLAAAPDTQSTLLQLARSAFQVAGNALQADRKARQAGGTVLQADGSLLQLAQTIVQLARRTLQTTRKEAGTDHSRELSRAGDQGNDHGSPARYLGAPPREGGDPGTDDGAPARTLGRADFDVARAAADLILQHMIALQEELDWLVYRAYGLLDDTKAEHQPAADAPPINLGERAFEIVMARKMEAGTLQTEWFRRHGSTPITQIPAHWPAAYQKVVEHRIALIEAGANQNKDIALIEQPEYKRRWNTEKWEEMEERALREWLLDRLEWGTKTPSAETANGSVGGRSSAWDERDPKPMTAARLADAMRTDTAFLKVAGLYRGRDDFDLSDLVTELVEAESVPFLPVLRYKESGLLKRRVWERTWELQREEDRLEALREPARARVETAKQAVLAALPTKEAEEARKHPEVLKRVLEKDRAWKEAMGALAAVPSNPEIEVPPRYSSADFLKSSYWNKRGKLDVPKERFVSYPGCGPDGDPTPLLTWAGFDHLQQAKAIIMYYTGRKQQAGWEAIRFFPLLAGLLELLPWLKQWHSAPDAEGHVWPAVIEGLVADECRELSTTPDEVARWVPEVSVKQRGRPKKQTTAEITGGVE